MKRTAAQYRFSSSDLSRRPSPDYAGIGATLGAICTRMPLRSC
jgi:hypothetical protein